MNKKYFVMIQACIVLLSLFCFTACNDKIENELEGARRGVNILTNPMEVGQTISITGPNFKNATAIVFPDNISVSNFERLGDFQLNVVVPQGVKNGGNITIKISDGDFVIPIAIEVMNPVVTFAYPASGEKSVGPSDVLVAEGKDLANIKEVILPGGYVIEAMDFQRKVNESIRIVIPLGTSKVITKLQLKTLGGQTIYSANDVDFTGDGYVPPELLLLCGRDSKSWTWNEAKKPYPYGMDGFGTGGIVDGWWGAPFLTGEGLGASMTFSISGRTLVLNRTDDTKAEGTFKYDMSKKRVRWSYNGIGELATSGVNVLSGQCTQTSVSVEVYDFLKLTDTEMILGYPSYGDDTGQWDAGTYWYFVAIEK